jgi:NAD(P)-dependent dehydrogenase (short-subunit alcohol dehydrogenase family)
VIAGGLGGIGRSIAQWLVHRGAKHLILLSRSGGNVRARKMLDDMRTAGVDVQCPRCDISDIASLKHTLQECDKTMPKIRGCIQATMVLRVNFHGIRNIKLCLIVPGFNFCKNDFGRMAGNSLA